MSQIFFFVYGTLCRGQCRQHCWPKTPDWIASAWVRGTLFGRQDYPSLRPGDDRVLGECWAFPESDSESVLNVLDAIEGTNQPGQPNLYDRVQMEVHLLETPSWRPGSQARPPHTDSVAAFGYHYATDPTEDGFRPMHPDSTGVVRWPAIL